MDQSNNCPSFLKLIEEDVSLLLVCLFVFYFCFSFCMMTMILYFLYVSLVFNFF
ncbi:hypothetical protein Hanom_Chr01g00001981 [Helianthus anomalus]